MKYTLTLIGVAAAVLPCDAQPPTAAFKAEQRLADLLVPGAKTTRETVAPNPPPRKPSRLLDTPAVPFTTAIILPPPPPKPVGVTPRPRPTPEETPFVRSFNPPETPVPIEMPVESLVRLWSPDVNAALPLPILSNGVRDRASLDDPSLHASVAAALAKISPTRAEPVPFQAQNLPDPFEFAHSARLRHPPEESSEPPLSVRPLGLAK